MTDEQISVVPQPIVEPAVVPQVNMKPSKGSLSLSGYNFKTWLAKNSGQVKIFVSLIFGSGGLAISLASGLPVTWAPLIASVSGLVGKYLSDLIDYYVTIAPQ